MLVLFPFEVCPNYKRPIHALAAGFKNCSFNDKNCSFNDKNGKGGFSQGWTTFPIRNSQTEETDDTFGGMIVHRSYVISPTMKRKGSENMKTYFVTSDIHGYCAIWMNALTKAGFDVANPDHILIVLGDIFDRGEEGPKVYDFLRLLPKERRILIKGNHEELLLELLERGYPLMRDEHNCTDKTLEQFAYGYESLKQKGLAAARDMSLSWEERSRLWNHYDDLMQKRLYKGKAIQQVAKWIQSDEWVDYYETPHFVFVHAWVPMRGDEYYCEYDPNWKKASSSAWYQARWRCPYRMFLSHFWDEEYKKGKTLVCGHWHTSDFYNHMDYVDKPECRLDYRVNNPIYQSQDFPGLIGIDACTALTHVCNVLVLTEKEL